MGLILDLSPRTLEKVLYFASYIVLDAGNTALQYKQVLSESEYQEAREQYGNAFRVGMGARQSRNCYTRSILRRIPQSFRQSLQTQPVRSARASSRDWKL